MTEALSAAEIARLAGVGRAAVTNWRKRHEDFPRPLPGSTGAARFDAELTRQWLRAHGKLGEQPLADILRDAAERLGDDLAVGDAIIGATRARELESTGATGREDDVVRLLADSDVSTIEEFVADWAARRGVGPSPAPELADLMYRLSGGGRVLDPFCRGGELLRPAAAQKYPVRGQCLDEVSARVTSAVLRLHADAARIDTGHALRADATEDEVFPAVLTVPPWGEKDWSGEDVQFDARWEFGLPPRTSSELAWVQHAVAHLDEQGTAVVALPAGVGVHRAGRRVRAELVRRGALRAVVGLPTGAFRSSAAPSVLWVLRRPSEASGVLMVDGAHARANGALDWDELLETALPAWEEFDASADCPEQQGVCGVVSAIDLLDEAVDLSPARHLAATVQTDVPGLRTLRGQVADVVGQLPELIPAIEPSSSPRGPTTSVGELGSTPALTVHRQSASVPDGKELPALTARDVVSARAPSGQWGGRDPIWLRPDDVVLPMMGGRLTSRVIDDEKGVLGPQVWLLRVDPELVDPWFLAGFLRCSANLALTSGSVTARLDVRRVELPRLPIDEQRVYGEAFRSAMRLDEVLDEARRVGTDLVTGVIDGLAGGALRPVSDSGDTG
ncbi:N-6 DNA methylase [Allosaccharopolyspora coralli]|uniref:N-6 DNA methylase n=1 Tax=Allosaccharopolyspora coralli TaxID=2665642 RepID=A0A5Q3Q516_9PSEU|nr:N-6 DNA methylase [Allosaccharopolyspora coralli]QGK68920.1 N-6 DNA methylase [Allosaccharopolyspora coralli]